MKEMNRDDLRWELRQMSSEQLKALIREETEKEVPDDFRVLEAVHILEQRQADAPEALTEREKAAWKQYRQHRQEHERSSGSITGGLVKAAVLALAVGLLLVMVIPQESHAGSFWKIFATWTDSIFEYKNLGDTEATEEAYVFRTDNPGLQQVYDAVVEELGITEPVVPMWLPEIYKLENIELISTPAREAVIANFKSTGNTLVMTFSTMKTDISPQYDKEDENIKPFEKNGVVHSIINNSDSAIVSWTRQNIKCSICVECREDVLKEIIRSIY